MPSTLSTSGAHRRQEELLTLAVEYGDPAVLQSNGVCSSFELKVEKDLAFLGFPRPSPADIELRESGRVDVLVMCSSLDLERARALEFGWDENLNARKAQCGIKRLWNLSRPSDRLKAYKRSSVDSLERQQKRPRINTHQSSWESHASPTKEIAMRSYSWNGNQSTQSHGPPSANSREIFNPEQAGKSPSAPDFPLPRIRRLDTTELPAMLSPTGEEPESTRTLDPRISRPRLQSPGSFASPIPFREDEQVGYESGSSVMLVETDETLPCGTAARNRRQFEREIRREVERRKEVERERDEAREQVRKLESELKTVRLWDGETCLGSESGSERERSKGLEARFEDVRRECQHPFVVPALLDAFLKMGELSDRIVNRE